MVEIINNSESFRSLENKAIQMLRKIYSEKAGFLTGHKLIERDLERIEKALSEDLEAESDSVDDSREQESEDQTYGS